MAAMQQLHCKAVEKLLIQEDAKLFDYGPKRPDMPLRISSIPGGRFVKISKKAHPRACIHILIDGACMHQPQI
jgi:hypothetical protein